MPTAFHDWIKSTECFETLTACAGQVALRASQMGITLDDAHLEHEDRLAFNKAVAADLWQFLISNAEKISSKATTLLLSGNTRAFSAFIISSFLDHCLDKRRTDSPFHAYYRHMRTVLSQTDGVQYRAEQRKGACYAWSATVDLPLLPDSYEFKQHHLDYRVWAASQVPFSDIHEKPAMLTLSHNYWDQALERLVQQYLLPIRGLVAYVATKYPLVPQQVEPLQMDDTEEETFDRTRYDGQQQLPLLPVDIIDTDLAALARDCVHELSATERAILILQAEQKSLGDIARLLGMRGPSNVSYHKENAYRKLRLTWSLWGLPDSEHYSVAEEEQELFFKKVIVVCKELYACRDNSHGEEHP